MLYRDPVGEWTEYRPPKRTAFGHQARKRDPLVAWRLTREFLDNHCAHRLAEPTIQVWCYPAGPVTPAAAAAAGLEQATARFGEPARNRSGLWQWRLEPSRIEEAIETVAAVNGESPDVQIGPLTVSFTVVHAWRDLAATEESGPEALDVHRYASMLGVGVWRTALFLQPHFIFPLAWDDPELAFFLGGLEQDCPFRFRDAYFYRLIPGKDGTFTQTRKLGKGWRES